MFIPSIGAVGYAPYNTLKDPHTDMGFEVSLENNISLLGGLKALAYILQVSNPHAPVLPVWCFLHQVEGFLFYHLQEPSCRQPPLILFLCTLGPGSGQPSW